MPAEIIDRGRGPEIAGTRVTVYRVMDYVREGDAPAQIASELGLTNEELQAALNYIHEHRAEVEKRYAEVIRRVNQPNPDAVTAGRAADPEELKRRIRDRHSRETAHADRLR